jgi:hypothetical protein
MVKLRGQTGLASLAKRVLALLAASLNADDNRPVIVEHMRPYMLCNPFMTEFHIFLMDQFAKKLGV